MCPWRVPSGAVAGKGAPRIGALSPVSPRLRRSRHALCRTREAGRGVGVKPSFLVCKKRGMEVRNVQGRREGGKEGGRKLELDGMQEGREGGKWGKRGTEGSRARKERGRARVSKVKEGTKGVMERGRKGWTLFRLISEQKQQQDMKILSQLHFVSKKI